MNADAPTRIIAKRQPTASDLRLVMVISKTIAELERIGDVADKICRTALEKFSQQHQPLLVSLESLGRHTIQMLHDVLDAFARMDIDEAVRIYREDKKRGVKGNGIPFDGFFNQRRSVLVDTFAIFANSSSVIAFINTSI